ncbi:hypothetical protein [Burkholderia ubonensis]|uniref:hypothetical protein n=1 Tax=Burkholderia ubonensis TaxID=101571 RepID=UPI000AA64345|nr:hypothetical protein [Burkholderia ubonensis]
MLDNQPASETPEREIEVPERPDDSSSFENPSAALTVPQQAITPEVEDVTEPTQAPLQRVTSSFLRRTDDMVEAYLLSLEGATNHIREKIDSIRAQIKPHIASEDDNKFSIRYPDDIREASELAERMRRFDRINGSNIPHILASSLFIGVFSQFDAFMGSLLKEVYSARPELFKGINKDISLKDLIDMGSIEAVKQYILEKDIDTFRRESYSEQFAILERKFSIKTLRKCDEWKPFIEMSQRRNLLTHNDGVVNEQYLQALKNEGYDHKSIPTIGKRLRVKPHYFVVTCLVLSTLSVMLTHTLWRALLPEDIERESRSLTETVYDLLLHERYNVAIPIGKFSLKPEVTKNIAEADIRVRAINLAIAYKHCDAMDEARKLLNSYDWSATPRDFALAKQVLYDEFPEAIESMLEIGRNGMFVSQIAYHDWPLFVDFRKRQDFRDAYRKIYDCDFEPSRSDEPKAETIENILELEKPATCNRSPEDQTKSEFYNKPQPDLA